jgi:hypothetical protein
MGTNIKQQLTDLKNDLAQETTVVASVSTFIQGLSSQLTDALAAAKANGVDEQDIADLVALDAGVKANIQALTAATVQNTPAATEPNAPPPTPIVEPPPAPATDPAAPAQPEVPESDAQADPTA